MVPQQNSNPLKDQMRYSCSPLDRIFQNNRIFKILELLNFFRFVKYIYEKRGIINYDNELIIINSITFLKDISRAYIDCLQRIFYHKKKIFEANGKLTIDQSFKLENMRQILQQTFNNKKFKYSNLTFTVNCREAVRFQSEVERLKEDMSDFSMKLKSFYNMLLKRSLDLKDVLQNALGLIRNKNSFDLQFKKMFQVFRMNKELLLNYYYYKHFLLFDDTHLKEFEESLKNCFRFEHNMANIGHENRRTFSKTQNLMSDSYVIMLKITHENILISYVSPNCLDLFEVLNVEDLINKSINNFMPHNIAKEHDGLLVSG